jgi:hypothetical protein
MKLVKLGLSSYTRENTSRVLKNKELRRIFGPTKDEVI